MTVHFKISTNLTNLSQFFYNLHKTGQEKLLLHVTLDEL